MVLLSLSVVGLHDAISLHVRFNEDITLLVGINGCGKTSVLNTIDWLLKPDLARLAVASYEKLSLAFREDGQTYTLTAVKTDAKVVLTLSSAVHKPKPIVITLDNNLPTDEDTKLTAYGGLRPEKHEFPMWDLLKSFAKPTVISLDRTISAESEEVQYLESSRGNVQLRTRSRSPLSYVQDVTSAHYAEYRSRAIANDDELKAQILMSALQPPLQVKLGPLKTQSTQEINKLEEKVTAYLSGAIKTDNIKAQIRRFFDSSRLMVQKLANEVGDQRFVVTLLTSQYNQIEKLAKAFNDFETKNTTAFKSLSEYLAAINRFFNDSNKELYFDESTGQLVFSFIGSASEKKSRRAITHLSSGERQLLILFTFLAFASQSQSVFIVDEPELSLHPKWQHEFMETFLSLRPEKTQLLLATHSPDIVGRHRKACVTLRSTVK